MKKIILLLFVLLVFGLNADAAKFYPYPQDCSLSYDTDGNGKWGAADSTNCIGSPLASPDAFNACTDGFCAYFSEGQIAGTMAVVSDDATDGGEYVGIPNGKGYTTGQGKVCGTFNGTTDNGHYKVWIRYIADDAQSNIIWLSPTPFKSSPPSSKGVILPITHSYAFPNNAPLYVASSIPQRTNGTTAFDWYITGSAGQRCLYYQTMPTVKLDSIYISKADNPTPITPTVVIQPISYEIQSWDGAGSAYSEPTAAGDSIWTQTNQVPWNGYKDASYALTPKLQIIRKLDGSKLYVRIEVDDTTSVAAATTARDDLGIFSDSYGDLRIKWNQSLLLDTSTIGLIFNPNSTATAFYDFIYDSSQTPILSVTSGSDSGGSKACTVTAGVKWVCFFTITLPTTVASGTVGLMNALDLQNSTQLLSIAFGTTSNDMNDPTKWGSVRFSATAVPPAPPDATAPTVSSCTNTTPTSTGATVSCTLADAGTEYSGISYADFAWDTVDRSGVYADYANKISNIAISGSACNGQATSCTGSQLISDGNLTPGATIYYTMVAHDGAGNTGHAEGNFPIPTPAPSGTRYISPSGNDSYDGTTNCIAGCTGTPVHGAWKTFAHALAKAYFPSGSTLIVMNGTYTKSTTGLPSINCANTSYSGTVGAYSTIQAANERQALLQSDGSGPAFGMYQCSYWNVIGLHGSSTDLPYSQGGRQLNVFDISSCHNVNLRRLLGDHNNRYFNSHIIGVKGDILPGGSSNILVEESEAYFFHRHGITIYHAPLTTVRRSYANARDYADLRCDGVNSDGNHPAGHCNDSWAPVHYSNAGDGVYCSQVSTDQCSTTGQAIPWGSEDPALCRTAQSGDSCGHGSYYEDATTGDEAITFYPTVYYGAATDYGELMENSVTENAYYTEMGDGTAANPNQMFGNISLHEFIGLFAEGATNMVIKNNVGVNNTGCMTLGGVSGLQVANNTCYNGASGFAISQTSNISPQSPKGLTATNLLSFQNSTWSYWADGNGFYTSCNVSYSNTGGNPLHGGDCGFNSMSTAVPTKMGTSTNQCIVYVPCGNDGKGGPNPYTADVGNCNGGNKSNMAGIGTGTIGTRANDMGADIVWEYTDSGFGTTPTLSTQKLWCQSGDTRPECKRNVSTMQIDASGTIQTGMFPCGAIVTGLNDNATGTTVQTQACINVYKRLFPTGCSVP